MGELLGVDAAAIHVVRLGLHLEPFLAGAGDGDGGGQGRTGDDGLGEESPAVVGYLGRIAPEKGFGVMVEAFLDLARRPGNEAVRLEAAGWLGAKDRAFFAEQVQRLRSAGLGERFRYHGEVDLAGKLAFLRRLSALSFPTVYREPKGLPVLEAMALAVPVVQPAHGSFPELLEATGGGLLVEPRSPSALADGFHTLLHDPGQRRRLGESGRRAVHARFTDEAMARETLAVYGAVLERASRSVATPGAHPVGG
jgi:glycosyltransferase involved in cell wall biosynthesis